MWDRRVVEKNQVCGVIHHCNFEWAFAGVYDPNVDYDRRLL